MRFYNVSHKLRAFVHRIADFYIPMVFFVLAAGSVGIPGIARVARLKMNFENRSR